MLFTTMVCSNMATAVLPSEKATPTLPLGTRTSVFAAQLNTCHHAAARKQHVAKKLDLRIQEHAGAPCADEQMRAQNAYECAATHLDTQLR